MHFSNLMTDILITLYDMDTGYWRQMADERLGDPPPGFRDRDGKPPRGPPDSALLPCV